MELPLLVLPLLVLPARRHLERTFQTRGQQMERYATTQLLQWAEQAQKKGNKVYLQAVSVGNDNTMTFADFNLLDGQEDWRDVTLGTTAERKAKMQDPARRERLRRDYDHGRMPIVTGPIRNFIIKEVIKPENKQWEGMTLAELGEAQGRRGVELERRPQRPGARVTRVPVVDDPAFDEAGLAVAAQRRGLGEERRGRRLGRRRLCCGRC